MITDHNKDIATAFSKGEFSSVYDKLADNIEWNIVGERLLKGKEEVTAYCQKTAQYFSEVDTDFRLMNVIAEGNQVMIDGTAEFISKSNKSTYISSCDVYSFEENKLREIYSYCIRTNKS
ncbi:nuclear transport factor 2 family protein [uncultured Roseivirga sp.]|uniref:nuclear transport factor 2 family protein n=1 Tax=uncultured Roseivirga sp. TaxID=543088 RepID=UPI0030DD69AD|tara:strand:- start:89407 stop:89766 length:360 start_codon:yes stop_codon:yes gene_type:complete